MLSAIAPKSEMLPKVQSFVSERVVGAEVGHLENHLESSRGKPIAMAAMSHSITEMTSENDFRPALDC